MSKKYTRKQLLQALGDCQNLFGQVSSVSGDRNPNRAAQIDALSKIGFEFCVQVLNTEKPVSGSLLGPVNVKGII